MNRVEAMESDALGSCGMRPRDDTTILQGLRKSQNGRAYPLFPGLSLAPMRRLAAMLRRWAANAQQRAILAGMDDRMLRDVGLDRATAHEESSKWFWQW
jgi:uncharacterized protein YjiS (DUF1127 family)